MSRPLLPALKYLLSVALLVGCLPAAMAASTPTLFSMASGKAEVLAQGAQKSWPIKVSEDNAFDAVFQGGMWLPNPAGGRIYAKYQRHILHANGTWTWVGSVETVHGAQPVVLTFGADKSVFGLIPQASGYPLRIVSNAAGTHVVETSATAMAQSAEALRVSSARDYVIPPKVNPKGVSLATATPSVADAAPVQAAASGPVTIDVMVVYTSGYVSAMGSQSKTLTRIQNLVDVTNAAYTSSGVNQQIRLVKTAEVNYPDNTSNQSALDDITGINESGGTVPIPASLQNVASLRDQYGADLVTLLRGYDNATQGGCGVGWLIGGNMTQIVPSQQKPYGYNVVSDGKSGGYFCLDTTFAHELGHNMGSAHDRANATEPGAYSYSYGYLGNGASGFSTIMAYGAKTATPLSVFSNPNISTCQNSPCGVPDSNTTSSADNVHSLNNTAALIAAFEPTTVGTPPPLRASLHNDVNGDGKSDLLFQNTSQGYLGWWLMNGTQVTSTSNQSMTLGYSVVATGDFNGDGKADIVWISKSNALYIWLSNGSGFTSQYVATVGPGWKVVGAGDVDGDGKADLLFQNPTSNYFGWWIMNGAQVLSMNNQATGSGYSVAAIGDFDGDGKVDIAWTNASRALVIWMSTGSGFVGQHIQSYGPGWKLLGAGDVDGDGKADLLFSNSTSSYFGWWTMNGIRVLSMNNQATGAGYYLVATGDFNGDGKADLLWTNSAHNLVIWTSNGNGFTGQHISQSYSSVWSPIP
ncbi:MAG: VCBS repeat-containing protein [Xanthomonadales bacterium]|nr:VCBS repeat-containing protein [Xanthomonadales bacterium]OJY85965.1 MAG: hypothetical protein BGP23_04710 [Xanthomonadales bacterium 66-474]